MMRNPDRSSQESEPKPPRSGGGPRTAAGKLKSRKNATKHGLTATTLLPAILGPENLEEHLRQLREEWQPQTPTQDFLIIELARHSKGLFVELELHNRPLTGLASPDALLHGTSRSSRMTARARSWRTRL
jgi:hypothetical protein